ncbi:hypothetical protein AGLY_012502 [Aphis glycines]|uniref:Uncharacterized protein n=1 Tax=Aphis glycines TaxID=307491 RepID=A0A6G0T8P0_APHGL|nr:hypothetical protein AGLY_012502 [Aphis glycines]
MIHIAIMEYRTLFSILDSERSDEYIDFTMCNFSFFKFLRKMSKSRKFATTEKIRSIIIRKKYYKRLNFKFLQSRVMITIYYRTIFNVCYIIQKFKFLRNPKFLNIQLPTIYVQGPLDIYYTAEHYSLDHPFFLHADRLSLIKTNELKLSAHPTSIRMGSCTIYCEPVMLEVLNDVAGMRLVPNSMLPSDYKNKLLHQMSERLKEMHRRPNIYILLT